MSFNEKVWAVCARVPKGKVTTYASIARKLGTQAIPRRRQRDEQKPLRPPRPLPPRRRQRRLPHRLRRRPRKKERLLKAEGVVFINGKVDLQQSAAEL